MARRLPRLRLSGPGRGDLPDGQGRDGAVAAPSCAALKPHRAKLPPLTHYKRLLRRSRVRSMGPRFRGDDPKESRPRPAPWQTGRSASLPVSHNQGEGHGSDTYLGVLPLFHSFRQTVIQNSAIAFGGTIVMLPRFDAHATIRLMLHERVTFFAGMPTMYWGLLRAYEDGADVSAIAERLRAAVAGGSALPAEVHRGFEQRFGVTILEGDGLSETSPVALAR
ncbi:AMP-binding protein [Dactylosporangium sp. CA-092794]|uniref:AMP-binding protein n=1 Tax=Dactylosporangium sp. CA-092794 TaxID=3239929 RepID=UPI003D8BEB5B